MKTVLVTGAAGFVGYHMSALLCREGYNVIGIDSMDSYYSSVLKQDRLARLLPENNFTFHKVDVAVKEDISKVFSGNNIDIVVHLAAQAGVRYSIEHPEKYIQSNIVGFHNVLEACRQYIPEHFIFASSSSVYGANTTIPYNTNHATDHPISLYAATKKANEVMAHSYAALYHIPTTGLRFFTVYGPWGRPDMAYFLFTDKIMKGEPIQLFNNGRMMRDFTYIDDIVHTIYLLLNRPPAAMPEMRGTILKSSESYAPYKLYNIGGHNPVSLTTFVALIEEFTGKKAIIENESMQPGDMLETYADIEELVEVTGYRPKVGIQEGLQKFVEWYKNYYNDKQS